MQENPLGLKGLESLEFCAEPNSTMPKIFEKLGLLEIGSDPSGDRRLYTQGQIRFFLNTSKRSTDQGRQYFTKHGEGVCKITFAAESVEGALEQAQKRGAKIVQDLIKMESEHGTYYTGAIQGFGDVVNEFLQGPSDPIRPWLKLYPKAKGNPLSVRLSRIDHLTNNVPKGELEHWVDFYQRIYGFRVTRYFDIKGSKTGLESKVVQSHDNSIIIPINEPESANGKSQIQEFLDLHKGAGVQHIAFMTPQILSSVADLRARGIEFLTIPSTYYQDISKRGLNPTESLEELEKLQLLVDGDQEGYLLQNFSKTYIGPLFFEIIQRKNHWGFGEGNFQALFDAIERDQMQRGYL